MEAALIFELLDALDLTYPKATYKVEVAWTANLANVFRIDISEIGGKDTIGGGIPESEWTDITEDVKQATIRRGRSDDLALLMSGSLTLTLKDEDGKYNPINTASPFYPNVAPMKPVRVTAYHVGSEYRRFYGYIQRVRCFPSRTRQEAYIECSDLFAWLQADNPVIAALGATTTGAAIEAILDALEFADPVLIDLDTGDTLANFEADGTQTALSLITSLLDAERGAFFISREGKAVYEDRHARYRPPRDEDQTTLGGTMLDLSAETDVFQVYNRITCTKTGGVPQTVTDDESRYLYARRFLEVTSDYFEDDDDALGKAGFILGLHKDAKNPVSLDLVNSDGALLLAMLQRDISDRIRVTESKGGTADSFFVESIEERIGEGGILHRATWRLSQRKAHPILIGYGEIGEGFITH